MTSIRTAGRRAYWKLREKLSGEPFDAHFYVSAYPEVGAAVREGVFAPYEHFVRFGRAEGREATAPTSDFSGPLPVSTPRTDIVYLELTSRCNLRCVYCAVSQPTYFGIDLPLEGLDNFIAQMKKQGVQLITMNGHGETTIVRQWDACAKRLADAGFRLQMTTNFAKRMTEAEIDVLSRYEVIQVSLDTVDGELLAKLRRGARIEQILENITAVQQYALARGRNPEMTISVVMTDIAAPTVGSLVDALLQLGVKAFRFGDLAEYDPIPGEIVPRHLTALSPERVAEVRESFRAAVQKIRNAGGEAHIDAAVESFLLRDEEVLVEQERVTAAGNKKVHSTATDRKQTRDCMDPWNTAFVSADASVRPCCFFEEKFGSLAQSPLDEIVGNEAFTELRRELLTGELRPNCAGCAARPTIALEDFQRKVSRYVNMKRPAPAERIEN